MTLGTKERTDLVTGQVRINDAQAPNQQLIADLVKVVTKAVDAHFADQGKTILAERFEFSRAGGDAFDQTLVVKIPLREIPKPIQEYLASEDGLSGEPLKTGVAALAAARKALTDAGNADPEIGIGDDETSLVVQYNANLDMAVLSKLLKNDQNNTDDKHFYG